MAHLEDLLDKDTFELVRQAKGLKAQLAAANERIHELEASITREIALGVSREKLKIGYDIHDAFGPLLIAAKLQVNKLKLYLPEKPEAGHALKQTLELLEECILSSRNLMHDAIPPVLLNKGLGHAVQEYCERVSSSNVRFMVKDPECDALLKPSAELSFALYKVVLEILSNCLKHSGARNIVVTFGYGVFVHISIVNDGLPYELNRDRIGESTGLGTLTIINRIEALRGSIRSEAGPPNEILVSVPTRQLSKKLNPFE